MEGNPARPRSGQAGAERAAVDGADLDGGALADPEHAEGEGRDLGAAAGASVRRDGDDPGPEGSAGEVDQLDHRALADAEARRGPGVEPDGSPALRLQAGAGGELDARPRRPDLGPARRGRDGVDGPTGEDDAVRRL